MKINLLTLSIVICLLMPVISNSQQIPDNNFVYTITSPAYSQGNGPLIYIDGAHNNFHTIEGGFSPVARLLKSDGYQVKGLDEPITEKDILNGCKILVIANPLHASNTEDWVLPTPSAFTAEEISIIKSWVEEGGSLFLIADHMPFAGAAFDLGKAFGFEFLNGFAYTREREWPPSIFSLKDSTLMESPITTGVEECEQINEISTFTGSAFKAPTAAIPVLRFLDENYSLQPDTAWAFTDSTPRKKLGGYNQGALLKFGKGRVAVFGEAAMFTAQIANGDFKVGLNSEHAPHNAQFELNLIHWLDGRIEKILN
ncbi:MAG: DUF4350 domain-containing protein [bacterium]